MIVERLEAANQRLLRKILDILWKDKITNVRKRDLTEQDMLEHIIKEGSGDWDMHTVWKMGGLLRRH